MSTDPSTLADAVLARWGHDPHALVQVLRETQAHIHWLSRPLLAHIARALHLTLAHVEGVATFYRFFHTRPVGRTRLLFWLGLSGAILVKGPVGPMVVTLTVIALVAWERKIDCTPGLDTPVLRNGC